MHFSGEVDLQDKSECGAEITLGHDRYFLLYPVSYSAFLDRYTKGMPAELHEFLNFQRQ